MTNLFKLFIYIIIHTLYIPHQTTNVIQWASYLYITYIIITHRPTGLARNTSFQRPYKDNLKNVHMVGGGVLYYGIRPASAVQAILADPPPPAARGHSHPTLWTIFGFSVLVCWWEQI